MAELVIAPALKPLEDGVKALVWVFLELTVDGDVARVANFFGQVGCVKNVLGFEVGVGLGAFQVAQVNPQAKVFERLVDEARVARLVARHIAHQLLDIGVFDVLENLVVQNAT